MRLRPFLFTIAVFAIALSGCTGGKKDAFSRKEVKSFEKSDDATVRLEGQKFPYCLWYDPEQWMIFNTPFDPCDDVSEWTLILIDMEGEVSIGKNIEKKAFAKTYTYDEKNVSRSVYKEFVQSKILGGDKENLLMFKDLGSEERIVNNIKVFAWKFEVEYQNIGSITTFIYFYSDSDGSVAISTFTPSDKWEENKAELEGLLNGFCLLQPSS